MNAISTFTFHNSNDIRIINKNGELWFVASDIANALDYPSAPQMTRNLDDDEKGMHNVHTLGGSQEMLIINESGLYSAILKSRKPEAKKFKKWVTSEVLPSIRKTSKYESPKQEKQNPIQISNKITPNDMNNIKNLIWHCSSFMDYKESFRSAVWYALRQCVGTKSPEPFNVEDLPKLGEEFERIIKILDPYLKARHESERILMSRLIRGRGDYDKFMKEILYKMRDSTELKSQNIKQQVNNLFKRDLSLLLERKNVMN